MDLQNYSSKRDQEKRMRVKHAKDCMEEIALRLLLSCGELHGYKLKKYLENSLSVYASPSEVYPILWSLDKRGIIKSERVDERRKVVYHPIPFITRNYLESKRDIENRNRTKINKIGKEALSFQIADPLVVKANNR